MDEQAAAESYIAQWASMVPSGTRMIVAKMKCAMAGKSCGCPGDSFLYNCPGPNPPVPIEFILGALLPKDGSPCAVPEVKAEYLPAPKYVVGGGHVHLLEFVGPGKSVYVHKL
jgi:hypothetical protein